MARTWLAAMLAMGCNGDRASPVAIAAPPVSTAAASLPTLVNVEDVASGLEHACALRAGVVYCWGDGLGTHADSPVAQAVAGLPRIAQISSGGRRTCALGVDGELACWGELLGELTGDVPGEVHVLTPGQPMPAGIAIRWGGPTILDFGEPITRVAVGMTHICAVTASGRPFTSPPAFPTITTRGYARASPRAWSSRSSRLSPPAAAAACCNPTGGPSARPTAASPRTTSTRW